jgi:hypothetical protein
MLFFTSLEYHCCDLVICCLRSMVLCFAARISINLSLKHRYMSAIVGFEVHTNL